MHIRKITPRHFSNSMDPVEFQNLLNLSVELIHQAPTKQNLQPFEFFVLDNSPLHLKFKRELFIPLKLTPDHIVEPLPMIHAPLIIGFVTNPVLSMKFCVEQLGMKSVGETHQQQMNLQIDRNQMQRQFPGAWNKAERESVRDIGVVGGYVRAQLESLNWDVALMSCHRSEKLLPMLAIKPYQRFVLALCIGRSTDPKVFKKPLRNKNLQIQITESLAKSSSV